MQNATKNHSVEIEIFNSDDSNDDNIEKEIEKRDSDILICILQIDIYMQLLWLAYTKKKDAINCLDSLVLSYLHYFSQITDDIRIVTAQYICYNLNLYNNDSTNSLKLDVKVGIPTDTSNI